MQIKEPLILYTREECHLCDQVAKMLDRLEIDWTSVDIDEQAELEEKYGLRVPVLQRAESGIELFYPFDEEELLRFAG